MTSFGYRHNLKKLNKVRVIAQTIKNPQFKRQYIAIITPVIDKYRSRIVTDDEMLPQVEKAIKQIGYIAKSSQYIDNKKQTSETTFDEHEKLFEVEMLCRQLLKD